MSASVFDKGAPLFPGMYGHKGDLDLILYEQHIYLQKENWKSATSSTVQSNNQSIRTKTVAGALIACLHLGIPPPDQPAIKEGARLECWLDPRGIPQTINLNPPEVADQAAMRRTRDITTNDALANTSLSPLITTTVTITNPVKVRDAIGQALQAQYEQWNAKVKYKIMPDPTPEDIRKMLQALRKSAKKERILIHYNGHGVPLVTDSGECWAFNKAFTQYLPIHAVDLDTWLSRPALVVLDCHRAGKLIDAWPDRRPYDTDLVIFGACAREQMLPWLLPWLPADMLTSALTTPMRMALVWHWHKRAPLLAKLLHEMPQGIVKHEEGGTPPPYPGHNLFFEVPRMFNHTKKGGFALQQPFPTHNPSFNASPYSAHRHFSASIAEGKCDVHQYRINLPAFMLDGNKTNNKQRTHYFIDVDDEDSDTLKKSRFLLDPALTFDPEKDDLYLHPMFEYNVPGNLSDRSTPLGYLMWVFTSIADTVAWRHLEPEMFKGLFRQDLLVASLARNFLLHSRIMLKELALNAVSQPPCLSHPALALDPLWDVWDFVLDSIIDPPPCSPIILPFDTAPLKDCFFKPHLHELRCWIEQLNYMKPLHWRKNQPLYSEDELSDNLAEMDLNEKSNKDWKLQFYSEDAFKCPYLPILLQALLSQEFRIHALRLWLLFFCQYKREGVLAALHIGIQPYITRLIQSGYKTDISDAEFDENHQKQAPSSASSSSIALMLIWLHLALLINGEQQTDMYRPEIRSYFIRKLTIFENTAQSYIPLACLCLFNMNHPSKKDALHKSGSDASVSDNDAVDGFDYALPRLMKLDTTPSVNLQLRAWNILAEKGDHPDTLQNWEKDPLLRACHAFNSKGEEKHANKENLIEGSLLVKDATLRESKWNVLWNLVSRMPEMQFVHLMDLVIEYEKGPTPAPPKFPPESKIQPDPEPDYEIYNKRSTTLCQLVNDPEGWFVKVKKAPFIGVWFKIRDINDTGLIPFIPLTTSSVLGWSNGNGVVTINGNSKWFFGQPLSQFMRIYENIHPERIKIDKYDIEDENVSNISTKSPFIYLKAGSRIGKFHYEEERMSLIQSELLPSFEQGQLGINDLCSTGDGHLFITKDNKIKDISSDVDASIHIPDMKLVLGHPRLPYIAVLLENEVLLLDSSLQKIHDRHYLLYPFLSTITPLDSPRNKLRMKRMLTLQKGTLIDTKCIIKAAWWHPHYPVIYIFYHTSTKIDTYQGLVLACK